MSIVAEPLVADYEVVYTTAKGKIKKVPEKELFLVEIKGDLTLDDYQDIYPKTLDFVVKTGWKKLVFNLLDMDKDDLSGRAWYLRTHLPEVFKKVGDGFRCAVIQPSNMFQRMALGMVVKGINAMGRKVTLKYMDSIDEAMDWI